MISDENVTYGGGRYFGSPAEIPDEGEIIKVDLEAVSMFTTSESRRRCWECDGIFCPVEEHVRAIINYPKEWGRGSSIAQFCTRECLHEWVTEDE